MENPSLDEVTRSSAQLSFARASQNLAILRRDGRSRSTALPGNAPIGEIRDLMDRESGKIQKTKLVISTWCRMLQNSARLTLH